MGMTIDEHIGVIEDLKSTMSVCMPEPEKTEICTSLSEAIDTMRKYQRIQVIINNAKDSDGAVKYNWLYEQITEEVEDGNG
jgi:hypothetical protein